MAIFGFSDRKQVPSNNYATEQKITSTTTSSLYPNLSNTTNNNMQTTAAYANPSTSQFQVLSNSL